MAPITVIAPGKYGCKLNLDDVEIGDILAPAFRPHIKIKRWAGQCDLAISYPTVSTSLVAFDSLNNKLIFTEDANTSIEIYPKAPNELNPEGSIEIDLILKKKPVGNKNTFTFKVESSTIDFQKTVGLDKEYTQAKCLEDFPKAIPPFVITPISITDSTGEVMKFRPEYLVNSYEGTARQNKKDTSILGKNKINGQDITYTRVSRTHVHLRRGKMTDANGVEAWVEDMNLDANGNLVITLPLDFLKNAAYPIKQAVGLDPAYTQDMDSWQSNVAGWSDATWSIYDLFTNKGVPKGAVAEIILSNATTGTENTMGVRYPTSILARLVTLHEAEGDGQTHCRMFVMTDPVEGKIEGYHSDVSDADYFYLVGYWENVTFTELNNGTILADSANAWDTEDISTAAANAVAHIIMANNEEAANTMGVRAVGSSLERKLVVHEEEAGGSSLLDLLVKLDANQDCQLYSSDTANAVFKLSGYFGAEMDFVELWQNIPLTTTSWEAEDLTAYLDQDGRMVDFLLVHSNEAAELYLGVRNGDDAATERKLLEHEAESAGAGGEYTGFGMSAQSNASGVVNLISSNAGEAFYLTGYFKPAAVGPTDYPISSTLAVGLASSNGYLFAASRKPTLAIGMVTSGAKVANRPKAASVAVGIISSATAALSRIRMASVAVGIVASSVRTWVNSQTSSLAVGIVSSFARVINYPRPSTVVIGIITSATRVISMIRTASLAVGIVAAGARIWASNRVSSLAIGIIISFARIVNYPRLSSVTLGLIASAVRVWNHIKASLVAVGLVTSATKAINRMKSSSVAVGIVSSALRSVDFIRTSNNAIGIVSSAIVTKSKLVISTCLIGIVSSATRTVSFARASSSVIGIITSAFKSADYPRLSAVLVGILTSASRVRNSLKTAISAVGIITSATRKAALIRLSTVASGIVASATKTTGYVKISSVSVGLIASVSRIWGVVRATSSAIGIVVSATADWVSGGITQFFESASVVVGIVTSASRTWTAERLSASLVGIVSTSTRTAAAIRSSTVLLGIRTIYEAFIFRCARIRIGRLAINHLGIARLAANRLGIGRLSSCRQVRVQ